MGKAESDLWVRYMRHGEFDLAWQLSDAHLATDPSTNTNLPLHLRSVWNGDWPAGRRVGVHCFHGLGDTIQFIRYTHLLKEIECHVTVCAQESLIPLLETMGSIDHLVVLGTHEHLRFDIEVEVMELPHLFRTTLLTIPNKVPYFEMPTQVSQAADSFAVGLVWQAGDWDDRRSIPFPVIEPLNEIPGVTWHILQRDAASAGWSGNFGRLTGGFDPLSDARIMRGLDLVISVDTMPAHLAGALAVPTWTLLPANADWRWMEDRTDSPWYPTMRLFRQRHGGHWKHVVEDVAELLIKTVRNDMAATRFRINRDNRVKI